MVVINDLSLFLKFGLVIDNIPNKALSLILAEAFNPPSKVLATATPAPVPWLAKKLDSKPYWLPKKNLSE